MWRGYERTKGVGKLILLEDVQKKSQMTDFKCLHQAANTNLTAFSVFGFRVCACLICRKRTLPQRGLSLVKLSGASTVPLRLPLRSGEEGSTSCFFALCCYILGMLKHVNVLQWQGELCAHVGKLAHRGVWISVQVPNWCLDFFPCFLFPPLMSAIFSKCLKTVFLSQIGIVTTSEQNSKAST